MTDTPKLNPYGYVNSPPLTSDQEAILLTEFAKGSSVAAAARSAKCTEPRARGWRNRTDNAKAIRELMIAQTIAAQTTTLLGVVEALSKTTISLESQVRDLGIQIRKTRKSVAYQRLNLTKARREVSDLKAERRRLRDFIHKTTGRTDL